MSNPRPLSDIVERLQEYGKGKADNSLFTGSEFRDEYGTYAEPMDSDNNLEIVTGGGAVNHAYTQVLNTYRMVQEGAGAGAQVNIEQSELNPEVIVGDMEIAVDKLDEGIDKLEGHDIPILGELRQIRDDIETHRQHVESEGTVQMQ